MRADRRLPMRRRRSRLLSSLRRERRSRVDVIGRGLRDLGALSHDAVTSDLAIAREQLSDLLQRLLVVALTFDPARVPRTWRHHLLRADPVDGLTPRECRGRARADLRIEIARPDEADQLRRAALGADQPGPRNTSVASAPVRNFASGASRLDRQASATPASPQARVVADQHHRPDARGDLLEACEQHSRRCPYRPGSTRTSPRPSAGSIRSSVSRAPASPSSTAPGRARLPVREDDRRSPGGPPAATRERAIVIGEP